MALQHPQTSLVRLFLRTRQGALLIIGSLLLYTSLTFAEEWQVNTGAFSAKRSPEMIVTGDGTVLVVYYNDQGQIIARRYQGESVVLNAGSEHGSPSGLALAAAGNHLYAAWRERHEQGFVLLLRHSPDGGMNWNQAVIVDTLTQPLTRIALTAHPQGGIHIAWLGERVMTDEQSSTVVQEKPTKVTSPQADPTNPLTTQRERPRQKQTATNRRHSYHTYTRYSPDSGKTWEKPYRLTAGFTESIWPTLLGRAGQAYSFAWAQRNGKKYILFTKTQADGHWQPPTIVKEVNDVLILKPYVSGKRLLAVWLNKQGNDFVIEGAWSDDDGQNWSPFTVEGTQGLDIATIEVAVQDSQLHLAFSARTVEPTDPWKQTVYYSHSLDRGTHWEKAIPLRHYPFPYTQALYPRLLTAKDQLVVAWNDYRNIRGDLYLNYSVNAGQDWLAEDQSLTALGRNNDYLFPFATSFVNTGGNYYLLAARYRNDSMGGAVDLILHQFELPLLPVPESLLTDSGSPEKQKLLPQAATDLWQSLVKGDYKTAFPQFDPFFRANLREIDYLASTGKIIYKSFTIKDVAVRGNIGRVRVEYAYEIPKLTTRQGAFSRPLTQTSAVEQWVFVQDRWYKEYHNELGGFTYTRY